MLIFKLHSGSLSCWHVGSQGVAADGEQALTLALRQQPVLFDNGTEYATDSFRYARVVEEQFRRRNSLL